MNYKKYLQLFNRMSVRIFFTIWFSMVVMVCITIIIPHFDQRRILPLKEQEEIIYFSRIAKQLADNPHFRRKHLKDRGRYVITVPEDIDARYRMLQKIDNDAFVKFIISTISSKNAYQQATGKEAIVGPFRPDQINANQNNYYIITPAPPQAYYLSRIYDSPILLAFLITLSSIPFVIILSNSLSKPMRRFKLASDRIARGNWEEEKQLETGPIEFQILGKSFNRMANALTTAENEKNRLFANLSHELRTPLTRIRLTNSLIRRKSNDLILDDIKRIEDNSVLIENRIQDMLSLSRQAFLNRELVEKINLKELLIPLFESAIFEANENSKSLTYDTVPETNVMVNIELFQSGLENVLRNAIYYAKQQIKAIVTIKDRFFVIKIIDDGCGIAEHDLDKIFEAFYRGERPDYIPDYGGSGLGLAITKQMIDFHHGTIFAENNHGLTITMKIPLS